VPNANGCREQTLFEHTLSDGASHGVITNVWHAGEPGWGAGHLGDPRMRVYVDEEVNATDGGEPAVDYTVALATAWIYAPLHTHGTHANCSELATQRGRGLNQPRGTHQPAMLFGSLQSISCAGPSGGTSWNLLMPKSIHIR
jgi:hypothetical protein